MVLKRRGQGPAVVAPQQVQVTPTATATATTTTTTTATATATTGGGRYLETYGTVTVFLFFLLFRSVNSLCITTYFNPDEYWQSLEPAYQLVFGAGHVTWEWTEAHQIRGWLHPLLFAGPYSLLQQLGLDTHLLIAWAPFLVQATLAAFGDVCLLQLAQKYHVSQRYTAFILVTCWFILYVFIRPFSNTAEMVFCLAAYVHWPFDLQHSLQIAQQERTTVLRNTTKALVWAAIACAVRPTAAVLWLFLAARFLLQAELLNQRWLLFHIVLRAGAVALLWVLVTVPLDTWCYNAEDWVLVPLNFFNFNVYSQGSALYGTHPWHWYLSEAVPAMMGLYVVPVVYALGQYQRFSVPLQNLTHLLGICIVFYSLNPHKEYRFILPVMPVLILLASTGLQQLKHQKTRITVTSVWRVLTAVAVVVNLGAVFYLGILHQRGAVTVVQYLANLGTQVNSIHFLAGCHSTPYYALLHQQDRTVPLDLFQLDCSPHFMPEIAGLTMEGTQTSLFKSDPLSFITQLYGPQYIAPIPAIQSRPGKTLDDCISASEGLYTCAESKTVCARLGEKTFMETCTSVTWQHTLDSEKAYLAHPGPSYSPLMTWVRSQVQPWPDTLTPRTVRLPLERHHNIPPSLPLTLPDVIVVESETDPDLQPFLQGAQYKRLQTIWHSHVGDTQYWAVYCKDDLAFCT